MANEPKPPLTPDDDDDDFDRKYFSRRWYLDALQSLVRWILNILAAGLIAKGYGTQKVWDDIIAVCVLLSTLGWAFYHQKRKAKTCKVLITKVENPTKDPNNETNDPQI